MIKIGTGVLSWDGSERRTDRYGAIVLDHGTYPGERVCEARLDLPALEALLHKRVRLVAVVLAARPSGHIGDLSHGIFPSQPDVGERVELGVGELDFETLEWSPPVIAIALEPRDKRDVLTRETFWMDPRKLYRLHDQTVELFAEETSDPLHAAPNLKKAKAGAVGAVEEEGSIQLKGIDPHTEKIRTVPAVVPLGDGAFVVSGPEIKPGKRVNITVDGKAK